MILPDYVTKEEVRRVCAELGLDDWTLLASPQLSARDAETVQAAVGGEAQEVSVESFRMGLETELEHGLLHPDCNVTNNHPVLTGRIVLAHLKESLDYYLRLRVAELEGVLTQAIMSGDCAEAARAHHKLSDARVTLARSEAAGYER